MILIASHLLFYFFLIPSLSFGADTLALNQSLSGDQTLISEHESFELGFFRAGQSPNYYIGIWYKNVPQTIVWVANRETPITNRFSSKFQIVDGNLVVLNESNTQIWSTNMTPTTTSSASVVLGDDGNLVLRYGSSSSPPIWQSFDHPTNTFLLGSKLGYDKRTNTKKIITSWKSDEDPAVGLFSLEIDQNEKQFVLKWNRSEQYWASGSWDGRIFSSESEPEMSVNYIYNFSYIDNVNESYFTFSLYDPSIISRFVIGVTGQIEEMSYLEYTGQWNLFWSHPRSNCEVYAVCGPFATCKLNEVPFCNCLTAFKPRSESAWNLSDFSGGCVRKTEFNCSVKEEKPGFIEGYVPVKFLSTFLETKTPKDESSCKRSCLDDCSCDAYGFISNKCLLWNSDILNNISLLFVPDDSDSLTFPFNIKVASKYLPYRKKSIWVTVGSVIGSVAGVVFVVGLILFLIYTKKRIWIGKKTKEGKREFGSLVAFVYKDLQIATKNFSNKLGEGGFGSVFKGVLRDSSIVAVKKLESISQGEKQFRSEISTIGIIQHVNLVRLRGFCAQGNNKLLVYEYMANGSLETHLFHEKQVLNWKTRYQIALGTTRGLVYLHEKCRDCIIHCDIKPENILLDADFCPKIADFGLAKLVGRDFSRVLTTTRGSIGYTAPEWLSGVAITAKADVYSYGMMLFELVYGKRNAERSEDSRSKFFPSLVWRTVMEGGDILSLLDSRLNREADVEEVTKVCKVACWCIQDDEDSRPAMSMVERILEGVVDVTTPPIPQICDFNS